MKQIGLLFIVACAFFIMVFAVAPERAPIGHSSSVNKTVFRGSPANLIFCEGDDTELQIVGAKLVVKCADQRRTMLSVVGSAVDVGNMNLDCNNWCEYAIRAEATDLSIHDMVISYARNGIFIK